MASSSTLLMMMMIIISLLLQKVPLCKATSTPRKLVPVPTPRLVLPYHNGPLLTGPSPLNLYFLWYGTFSPSQKQILLDFASSFSSPSSIPSPSVSSWWATASSYTDAAHAHVSSSFNITAQASVQAPPPSPGASISVLKREEIPSLLLETMGKGKLPVDAERGVYFVLTGAEVAVEGMCMSMCGFHDHAQISDEGGKGASIKVVYGWVGNAERQCPGECVWPFAVAEYGPKVAALVPPNGDAGMDGMVINMATLLAGIATNPFGTGYFQGSPTAPLEAVSACTGIFGLGAYPGYPGSLLTNPNDGASFNARGTKGRAFLLPSIWNPSSQTCSPPS